MSHCRLIYQSTCTRNPIDNEDLRDLVQRSAEHNRAAGITGLLLLSGNRFLQVVEGPSDAVNALFGRIMRDQRHRDVQLLTYEPIGDVYFDDWNMYPFHQPEPTSGGTCRGSTHSTSRGSEHQAKPRACPLSFSTMA